ncbi:MAG TPA: MauE/DoxX family redox-associated membrane protein [Bryobacteraceae bacterium]|nr:MauE/DoxX family redox-associated membrane protein [Bryobacteraceae bacterium]
MRRLPLILRLLLAAVFLYAAYTKLRQPWLLFAMSIDAYQLLPEWAVLALGRTIPWLELALGILLATGIGLRYAATGASVLLAAFFAIMLQAYIKGMGIDCGCFGLGEKISPFTLARDGALLTMSITLAIVTFRARDRRVPVQAIIA